MATPATIEAKRYYRVAKQRLEDAAYLQRGGRQTAAVYLAGYAVECMLKSLVLESVPEKSHTEVLGSFRGSHGHSLEWLRVKYSGVSAATIPKTVSKSLTFVSRWSVDLRYEPGVLDPRIARRFLAEVDAVCHWADGRL